jgi:hypothetical protein
MTHVFDHYGPGQGGGDSHRNNGVLVSMVKGKTLAYALYNLQDRGRLFVDPEHRGLRGPDRRPAQPRQRPVVNPTKAKQLTNIRAAGTDEALILTPPGEAQLEQALEFIEDDELVEVTPESIRLRKKLLKEHERKRASRAARRTDAGAPAARARGRRAYRRRGDRAIGPGLVVFLGLSRTTIGRRVRSSWSASSPTACLPMMRAA